MDTDEKILFKKAELLLNEKVVKIEKLTKGYVNKTYKVSVGSGDYVFRIFAAFTWPEHGKIEFINKKLAENNIERAENIAVIRDDDYFKNGYMAERFINGQNAEDVVKTKDFVTEYYIKLAGLVGKIHKITIENYGYIGHGIASHSSFVEFISDVYDSDVINKITKKGLLDIDQLKQIKSIILRHISTINLPPVLCHGDISPDNVMISDNENKSLVLIDWDNATSGVWISDFSVMTYWMSLALDKTEYAYYRDIFLKYYHTDYPVKNLAVLEKAFHLLQGIKLLSFYEDKGLLEITLRRLNEDRLTVE